MDKDQIQWQAEIAKLDQQPKPKTVNKPLTASLGELIRLQGFAVKETKR